MFEKSPFLKISSLALVLFIVNFIFNKTSEITKEYKYTTYKINNDKVVAHKTTQEEVKKYKLNQKVQKRVPSSNIFSNDKNSSLKLIPFFEDNEEEWKNKLANDLLRFQTKETLLFVKTQKRSDNLKDNESIMLFCFRSPNNSSSFNAKVDTNTGKIIETWGRTIHESPSTEFSFRL